MYWWCGTHMMDANTHTRLQTKLLVAPPPKARMNATGYGMARSAM